MMDRDQRRASEYWKSAQECLGHLPRTCWIARKEPPRTVGRTASHAPVLMRPLKWTMWYPTNRRQIPHLKVAITDDSEEQPCPPSNLARVTDYVLQQMVCLGVVGSILRRRT